MKYLGLILIPLLVAFLFGGPGCKQSQNEPEVKMEQAPEKVVEAPVVEEPEEVVVEVDEVDVGVEDPEAVPAEAEKAGKGLMDQVKGKAAEEASEEIEKVEIE